MEDKKKVTKFHRVPRINIGFILLVFIFIYLIFHLVSFFTGKHIAVTEVKQGQIVSDNRFTALAIRAETLVKADESGEAYYYLPQESRVKKGETVVSIDRTGDLISEIRNGISKDASLSDEQKLRVTELLKSCNDAYTPDSFESAYYLKQNTADYLTLLNGEKIKKSLNKDLKAKASDGSVVNIKAQAPGLMCLSYDNLTGVTEDSFTKASFDESALKTTEVSTGDSLSDGDTAFRLVTDDNWKLVTPVSEALAEKLKSKSTIEVRFDRDGTSVWANAHLTDRDGGHYLVLEMDDSMDRFADSRYLDIELVLDNESGLKVPNSSLVTKVEKNSSGDYVRTYGVYLANKGYTQLVKVKLLYKNGQYSIIEPVNDSSLRLYDYIVLDASGVNNGEILNNN